jgi:hypothetical protein
MAPTDLVIQYVKIINGFVPAILVSHMSWSLTLWYGLSMPPMIIGINSKTLGVYGRSQTSITSPMFGHAMGYLDNCFDISIRQPLIAVQLQTIYSGKFKAIGALPI